MIVFPTLSSRLQDISSARLIMLCLYYTKVFFELEGSLFDQSSNVCPLVLNDMHVVFM